MPDGFTLDLDDEDVRRRIEWVGTQLADLRGFWPRAHSVFTGWMREQFATEGVFGLGRKWEPLSPGYRKRKARLFPGKTILQAEGHLRKAASQAVRTKVTPTMLELTIPWATTKGKVVKVKWHQEGTVGKPGPRGVGTVGHMPARPILFGDPLLPAPSRRLDKAMEDYMDDLLDQANLR